MKAHKIWVSLLGIAVLPGCMASREARSAGSVGCAPDEIEVGNVEHHGLLVETADTWQASCRGRTFICSEINRPSEHRDGFWDYLFSANASGDQITCQEEVETPQEARNREASHLAQLRQALASTSAPKAAPDGAAGFAFGNTREDAQRLCESAGHEWSNPQPQLGVCSGAASPLGVPAQVSLRFCGALACEIQVEHRPHADWSGTIVRLKAKLEEKYGATRSERQGIPSECRSEQQLVRCLDSHELELGYSWQWATGEKIRMRVGQQSPDTPAAIHLSYTVPASRLAGSAL